MSHNNEEILSKIKEIMPQSGERTKVLSEKLSLLLKEIPELEKYINEKNPILKDDIYYDLGRYINYHRFIKGNIIQRMCEGDKFFFMIVTGEIVKLGIRYKKETTTFREYILYLIKLQLLEENFLLNDCIEKNQELFPFKAERNIIKIIQRIKGFNFKNEYTKIKMQIKSSKWRNNPNSIEDYFYLINPSFINGKKSFLSKEMKFPIILPVYIKEETFGPNTFIGNLLKCKGIKEFSSYICISNADILYLDKSTVAPGCKLMNIMDNRFSTTVIENIIKKNIIFKNTNSDYLIKYYSQYFRFVPIKKGQVLISQGRPHEGIYFIIKGAFQLKSNKSFCELQELIFNLRDSLDSFTNYISYIKKREEDDLNTGGNNIKKKINIYKHPLFLIKSNEKQDITFWTFHGPQIMGLNESYGCKTGINNFSVFCLSDEAEVYFLPNELVNNLLSIDSIYNSIARLTEERVKFLLFSIKKYKNKFEEELENYISKSKFSTFYNLHKLEKKNLKTISPIDKKNSFLKKYHFQGNEISNNELNQNLILNDNEKNSLIENDNIINKKLISFDSLNQKENNLMINLKDQDKNSSLSNEIKLKNNKFLSPISRETNTILSDNNKSSKKFVKFNLSNIKFRNKRNNIIIQSPSMIDIKKNIFQIDNKNDSIINNTHNIQNILSSKNENDDPLTGNRTNKKHTFYKLLPLNHISQYNENFQKRSYNNSPIIKSNSNISKEKNFLKKLSNLYFNKKSEQLFENSIDNENENNNINKYKAKIKLNLRNDHINNSCNFNNVNLNSNNNNYTTLKNIGINYLNDINKNKINLKNIKSLNLIKSNSYKHFIIDKTNKFF